MISSSFVRTWNLQANDASIMYFTLTRRVNFGRLSRGMLYLSGPASGRNSHWYLGNHISGGMSQSCSGGRKRVKHDVRDRKQTTIWSSTNKQKPTMPTMKPVELLAYPDLNSIWRIASYSTRSGGSGSTWIAAEQTNRSAV
jgi:hypothetical protein